VSTFAEKIALLSDAQLTADAEKWLWASLRLRSKPGEPFRWQADACYAEAEKRGKPELYAEALRRAEVGITPPEAPQKEACPAGD
jgi:hypothetical protein